MKTRKPRSAPLHRRTRALPGWMTGANVREESRRTFLHRRESVEDPLEDWPDEEYGSDRWLLERPGVSLQSDEDDT